MELSSPLIALHAALGSAIHKDLPDVERTVTDYSVLDQPLNKGEKRPRFSELPTKSVLMRPTDREVDVLMFPQSWGSTALGYGGIGGAAVTPAYTVVVRAHSCHCVYFGSSGRLAYRVPVATQSTEQAKAYLENLADQMLGGRREAVERYGAELPETGHIGL